MHYPGRNQDLDLYREFVVTAGQNFLEEYKTIIFTKGIRMLPTIDYLQNYRSSSTNSVPIQKYVCNLLAAAEGSNALQSV
jgi:hypothetical protein